MKLGVHVSKVSKVLDDKKPTPDLSNAILRDLDAIGLNSAQVFTYGPQNLHKNKYDVEKVLRATTDIDLSVHSSYLSVSIWHINAENQDSRKSKLAITNIKNQLVACKEIKAWGLVVHISMQPPDVVSYVSKLIKQHAVQTGVCFILEMVSNKAHAEKTYETPEKINKLTRLIGPAENWWGWCIDTAHLWGAGVDIRSYESMKKWLDDIAHKEKIKMFHLNGSSVKLGSGKDKHEIPFSRYDVIWHDMKPKKTGLYAVVEFALKHDITIICEINRGSQAEVIKGLEIIKNLI